MKRNKSFVVTMCQENSRLLGLLDELITSIVAQVGSDNVIHLINTSMTCVKLRRIGRDETVLKSVSVDKFTICKWHPMSKEKLDFYNMCISYGNSKAMFCQGMFDFFNILHKGHAETKLLIRSAEEGYRPAIYAISLIDLSGIYKFSEDRLKNLQRSNTLQLFEMVRNEKRVVECRRVFTTFFASKQFLTDDNVKNIKFLCMGWDCNSTWKPANGKWLFHEESDDNNLPNSCIRCRDDHELEWFKKVIDLHHTSWGLQQ